MDNCYGGEGGGTTAAGEATEERVRRAVPLARKSNCISAAVPASNTTISPRQIVKVSFNLVGKVEGR